MLNWNHHRFSPECNNLQLQVGGHFPLAQKNWMKNSMGQPSGPGLLSFLKHLRTPSSSPLVTGGMRSSAISWSTNLGKALVMGIISSRLHCKGDLYKLEKYWMPISRSFEWVWATILCWSVSSQIMLLILRPFACCWKNLVFSSPACSQISLLLSLQSDSFCHRSLVLVASRVIRCSFEALDWKPLISESLSWASSSSILCNSSRSFRFFPNPFDCQTLNVS